MIFIVKGKLGSFVGVVALTIGVLGIGGCGNEISFNSPTLHLKPEYVNIFDDDIPKEMIINSYSHLLQGVDSKDNEKRYLD